MKYRHSDWQKNYMEVYTYTVTVNGRKIILGIQLYWEIFMLATALHFGNFVNARAAKGLSINIKISNF